MSKRHSIGSPGGNTLFNYFAKSPATSLTPKDPNKANQSASLTDTPKVAKLSQVSKTPISSKSKLENRKQ